MDMEANETDKIEGVMDMEMDKRETPHNEKACKSSSTWMAPSKRKSSSTWRAPSTLPRCCGPNQIQNGNGFPILYLLWVSSAR